MTKPNLEDLARESKQAQESVDSHNTGLRACLSCANYSAHIDQDARSVAIHYGVCGIRARANWTERHRYVGIYGVCQHWWPHGNVSIGRDGVYPARLGEGE